jgi:DNA gyrase/topoisomerase IV subunit A
MNFLEHDLPWLSTEARDDPATAQRIIEALAERVQVLQRQSDELRAENALIKRGGNQQTNTEQVQRLRNNLRELRQVAERKGLDRDVVTLLSFSGLGAQLPAPAPFEQTLPLATTADEPVGVIKPLFLASGTRFGSVLAVTSNLRMMLGTGLSLPVSENLDWRDARPSGALVLGRAERIEAMCAVDELQPPRDLMLVTRLGWVRVMSWTLAENLSISGQPFTLPGMGDSPVWLGACDADADVLLLTRNGRWTRFPIGMVPPIGCAGIQLESGDDVVSAVVLRKDERRGPQAVLFVGADGTMFVAAAAGLEAHKKPNARSVPAARKFVGLAGFPITTRKTEVVMALSNAGDFHVVSMKGLPIAAKPADAQPLKVAGQRLVAATML